MCIIYILVKQGVLRNQILIYCWSTMKTEVNNLKRKTDIHVLK